MIADVLHGRGDDRLHVGRTVIPTRLAIGVIFELFRTGRKLDLLAEEVELIMFRQGKVLY